MDIRHMPGEDNPVADILSGVDSVMMPSSSTRKSWHNNRQQIRNSNEYCNRLHPVSSYKNSSCLKQTALPIVTVFRAMCDHSFR